MVIVACGLFRHRFTGKLVKSEEDLKAKWPEYWEAVPCNSCPDYRSGFCPGSWVKEEEPLREVQEELPSGFTF